MNTALIKPAWSPLTIALMVLGFIVFWPLGVAMLAYILWGEYAGGTQQKADDWISRQKAHFKSGRCRTHQGHRSARYSATGNAAFDDYRDEQLKRLEEERRKLDEEREAFEDYLQTLRQARDREEFDRFMRERRNRTEGTQGGETPTY